MKNLQTTSSNRILLLFRAKVFYLVLFSLFLFYEFSQAQTAFTPGKIAVLVLGDGTSALSGAATPITIKEFNLTGASQSGVVRTTLPSTATSGLTSVDRALTQSGTSTSEGGLTLSDNRQFLVLAGYNSSSGTASVASSVSATFPTNTRVVGKIGADGVADTKTTLGTAYSGAAIRSSTSVDGTAFWTAGSNGLNYTTNGSIVAPTALGTTNSRILNIFNNRLYTSTQSGSLRLATIGTGLPTSGTQSLTNLAGFLTSTGDPYNYAFIDINGGGPDVLYVASLNTAPNGLLKYTSVDNGVNWVAQGSLTGNVFGVTGVYNSCTSSVDLYITSNTTNSKPNRLYKFTDANVTVGSPAVITNNGVALVSASSATLLATAATNTAFGGVAFTPGTLFSSPTAYNVSGGGTYCTGGATLSVNLSNSEIGVNYQLFNGITGGTILPGTGGPISFSGLSVSGTYSVVATNQLTGCSTTMSNSAIITLSTPPSATLSGGGTVCSNAPLPDVTITLTEASPWTFTYSNGTSSTTVIETSTNPYVITQAPVGNYTVTSLSDAFCTGTSNGSATVTVNPATAWYQDADNDGFGNPEVDSLSCTQPVGYLTDNTDCNDVNATLNPSASEICMNGIDDNCNTQIDENNLPMPQIVSISANPSIVCSGENAKLNVEVNSYCLGGFQFGPPTLDESITNVSLGNINNSSGGPDGIGGAISYSYYNNLSTNLSAGNPFTLNGTMGFNCNNVAAWIDYNQNGIFETSERVGTKSSAYSTQSFSFPFTVPTSAYNGTTRMRVRVGFNTVFFNDACYSLGVMGETEDYDVVISGGVDYFTYDWTPGSYLSDSTTLSPYVNGITQSTSYSLTITNAGGCSVASSPVNITVIAKTSWYADADNDGYGDPLVDSLACTQPLGYLSDNNDCNDANSLVYPGSNEICGNGIDDNCNGVVDENNALAFDGTNDFVAIPNEPNFDFTIQMTVEAWVKVNAFDKDWQAIVTKGDDSWRLHRSNNSNFIGFGTNGLSDLDMTGTININDGVWHHIAAVYDGIKKYLYVDGKLDTSVPATGTLANSSYNVAIGANTQVSAREFNGNIDDVRIWSVARTQSQIISSMSGGITPQSGLVSYYRFDQGIASGANTAETTLLDASGNNNHGALTNFDLTNGNSTSNYVATSITLFQDGDGDGYGNNSLISTNFCTGSFIPNNTDCNDTDAAINPGVIEICGNSIDDDCDTQIDEGCTSVITLNLNVFIQGFYTGSGTMSSVLLNAGVGVDPLECDTILVELHDQFDPTIISYSTTTMLLITGEASMQFPPSASGSSYYIVLRHRNSIETWSKFPVTFSGTPVTYDFTTP